MAGNYLCGEPCLVKVQPEVICIPDNLNDFMTCPAPCREYPQISTGEPRLLVPVEDMSKLLGIVDFLNNEVALLLSLRDTYKCSREDLLTKNSQLEIEISALADHCKKLDDRIKFFADEYEDLSSLYCMAKARINALQQQIETSRGGNKWAEPACKPKPRKEDTQQRAEKSCDKGYGRSSTPPPSGNPIPAATPLGKSGEMQKYNSNMPSENCNISRHLARSHLMILASFSGLVQNSIYKTVLPNRNIPNRKTYYLDDLKAQLDSLCKKDEDYEESMMRWSELSKYLKLDLENFPYKMSNNLYQTRNEIARPKMEELSPKDIQNALDYLYKTSYEKLRIGDDGVKFFKLLMDIQKKLPRFYSKKGGFSFQGWQNRSQNAATSQPFRALTRTPTSSVASSPSPQSLGLSRGVSPSLPIIFPSASHKRAELERKREKWEKRSRQHRNQ